MKKPSSASKYSAPALSKGLDILELLSEQPDGLKKNEIAHELNRSVNELYRMLAVLEARQYVMLDKDSERYSLTLRLFEMSHRFPPTKRLNAVAGRIMEETAQALNQSVHLAIPYGSDLLVIAQVDSPGINITGVRLGARVPLVLTTSGASLLHRLPKERRHEICSGSDRFSPEEMIHFEEAVEQVIESGICESASTVIQGVLNLSVPIFGHGGGVVAALTIPHVKRLHAVDDPDVEECKRILLLAGRSISEKIGAGALDGDIAGASRDRD